MDRIGPTFKDELVAAGVSLDGFAWGSDGAITYGPTVSAAQRSAIEAVLAAHDPTVLAPDTSLEDGLARPEIQAILDLIAQQQSTTVDVLQAQAITAHTAALAAKAQLSTSGATK